MLKLFLKNGYNRIGDNRQPKSFSPNVQLQSFCFIRSTSLAALLFLLCINIISLSRPPLVFSKPYLINEINIFSTSSFCLLVSCTMFHVQVPTCTLLPWSPSSYLLPFYHFFPFLIIPYDHYLCFITVYSQSAVSY